LIGAIIGALLVSFGRSYLSESYPDIWQYFMGALFIGSVLLFPQGIVGSVQLLGDWVARTLGRKITSSPSEATPPELRVGIQPSQAKGQS
jgi:urea transport system permease protein